MKKLILLSVMLLQIVFLFAQESLQMFTAEGEQITNEQVIEVVVTDLDAFETVSEEYFVRNNSTSEINVKMKQEAVNLVDGAQFSFCALGNCFPPNVNETSNSFPIPAETTIGANGVFTGHYHAHGFEGTSLIKYTFFDADNVDDNTVFFISFNGSPDDEPSLQLLTEDGDQIENGETIEVEVADLGAFETVSEEYFIRNNSTVDLNIKMKMEATYLVQGTEISFCALGNCFPPGVNVTPNPFLLEGETTVGAEGVFTGHYHAHDISGTSLIRYTFFDAGNPNDSISFNISFNGGEEVGSSMQLLSEDGDLIENGQNIDVNVIDLDAFETVSHEYFVRNNSTSAIDIKMRQEPVSLIEGAEFSFCFGSCFPPGTNETPHSVKVDAETTVGTSGIFTGHYHAHGNSGNSIIRYTYFNVSNLNDTLSFTITFQDATGIANVDENAVINAFPNPTSDILYISYDLKMMTNGYLNVYDALGKKVIVQEINSSNGQIELNVSDLPQGIYLYNFQSGNMKSKTYKLLIK
ncbi:MAG: T9SS type A sorting domain-containing protein [Bacteroidales bacterium]|nr:T9SS type A sorting domain-containing protein [Bacteroidales bacterium]